jgi:hypothetical protein
LGSLVDLFEVRTASHGETLIRSRNRKERLGLV